MIDFDKGKEKEYEYRYKNTRPCTIVESLTYSFEEVKLMQEGKLPKINWDDFVKEMRETNEGYEE